MEKYFSAKMLTKVNCFIYSVLLYLIINYLPNNLWLTGIYIYGILYEYNVLSTKFLSQWCSEIAYPERRFKIISYL